MKRFVLSLIIALISKMLIAQVPQGFNYQAIARDASGNPIVGATIKVKLSILSDTSGFFLSGGGTYIWEEEQTNVKTNAFGLFTLVFGNTSATKVQGSAASFSAIDWAKTPLYIGTKIANPTAYKNMGSAKLWSVPYSMVTDSTKALLKGSKLSVVSSNDLATDALFEVKRKDGQTVFAVYPDAVNIYVPRTAKGTKGGFAIGGFDQVKLGTQDYFRVTSDSVRIYIDKTPTIVKGATKGGFAIGGFDQVKGGVQDLLTVSNDSIRMYIDKTPIIGKGATKGGFAIGGFDQVKGGTQDLLTVSNDSIRMYINDLPGKGATKGGFAIGGFDQVKGGSIKYLRVTHDSTRIITADTLKGFGVSNLSSGNALGYLRLTPSNYFIGHRAGERITTGKYNSFVGYETGLKNTSGRKNVFLGYHAGYSNDTASYNVFIGNEAGRSNNYGRYNTFIGYQSGLTNTDGDNNVHLGYRAGYSSYGYSNVYLGTEAGYNGTGYDNVYIGYRTGYAGYGQYNVYIGHNAGLNNAGGSLNTFIGENAGSSNITGHYNVFLGTNTGSDNKSGDLNTYLGFQAGLFNVSGTGNVFIGSYAGEGELGSNRLHISNSLNKSLIFGEFDNERVIINGNSANNYLNRTFFVNGTAGGNYAWYNDSDKKLKHDIVTIPDALLKVLKLRGVNFFWNSPTEGMTGVQMGFIGQEVVDIVPEVVSVSNDHFSMQYAPITALLVEGMKEQQKLIESQQKQIYELKTLVNTIMANQAGQGNK